MDTSKNIRFVVIGTGHIGPRHAQSIINCDDTKLLYLVDPAPQAQNLAKELRVSLFGSVQQMLQQGRQVDAAIVCTPNNTHVEVAQELLAAGIHVLVEKPISTTISSAQDLLQTARSSGKHLLVGHHRRFNPYITATKLALANKKIGTPIAMSGIWATCKPDSYFKAPTKWRASPEHGGPILINMIHEVDLLQYLLGPIVRVHAEQIPSQRGHDAEEGAAILLRFASGIVGTFILSDVTPSTHSFESATGENPIIPKAGHDCYRIFGTEGTLSVGDMKLTKHDVGDEKSWSNTLHESSIEVGQEVPFDEQIKHFVRVIQGKDEPRCSGQDGLSALIVCDAIKQAIATGEAVSIDSIS